MKVKGRTFTYVVKKAEEGGYAAQCIELPQVHTEGETLREVKKNMQDALALAIDYLNERARKEIWMVWQNKPLLAQLIQSQ